MPPPPIVTREEIKATVVVDPDLSKVDAAISKMRESVKESTGMSLTGFKNIGAIHSTVGHTVSGIGGGDVTALATKMFGQTGGIVAGAAVSIVQAPFKIFADLAMNAANQLKAFNSQLGIVGVGYERQIQHLKMIPVIGDSLAKFKEAERATAETQLGFVKDLVPALVDQLQQAGQELRAAKGLRLMEQTRGQTRATRFGADIELTMNQLGGATSELFKKIEDFNEGGADPAAFAKLMRDTKDVSEADRNRAFAAAEIMKKLQMAEKTGITREQQDALEKQLKDIGIDLKSARGLAARPAKFESFLEYERSLQQRAMSQGDVPSKTLTAMEEAVKILDAIKEAFNRDPNADVTGARKAFDAAVRKIMEGK